MNDQPEFIEFPKTARLSREVIITEKIDGTNAQICITADGRLFTGSRTRWITPADDNYGFARWVEDNRTELLKLGEGRHFGEWWGSGIQRGYGLSKGEKHWSMFNIDRWHVKGCQPRLIETQDKSVLKFTQELPEGVWQVPVLYRGLFTSEACEAALGELRHNGSKAALGYKNPEGIVVWHTAARVGFKKTLLKDESPKSLA